MNHSLQLFILKQHFCSTSELYLIILIILFQSAASSDDLFSTVSSSHRTLSSVHTFGRQVLDA
jgi:hypothetical protein